MHVYFIATKCLNCYIQSNKIHENYTHASVYIHIGIFHSNKYINNSKHPQNIIRNKLI